MNQITSKTHALVGGIVAGVAAFIAWIANTPPEQQNALLSPLVECLPLSWRPQIGLFMRLLSSAAGIWSVYKASHSGPQTPPKNPPTE